MCVHSYMCMYVYAAKEERCWVPLPLTLCLFPLGQVCSLNLKLNLCLQPNPTQFTSIRGHTGLSYVGAGILNSDPHACAASVRSYSMDHLLHLFFCCVWFALVFLFGSTGD